MWKIPIVVKCVRVDPEGSSKILRNIGFQIKGVLQSKSRRAFAH